jgi:hypothetical protein
MIEVITYVSKAYPEMHRAESLSEYQLSETPVIYGSELSGVRSVYSSHPSETSL